MALRKRPKDVNQLAKLIADIATGEIEDIEPAEETVIKKKKAPSKKKKSKLPKKDK